VPAALADDRGTAIAIMNAETEVLPLGNALSKCLQASPTKNTPCIRRTSAKLAEAADRHLKLIRRALDGTERPCVRSVATHEMSFLLLWRDAARALYRNERKRANRLFTTAVKVNAAKMKVLPACLATVLVGGG
jgi:hypothetical protein